MEFDNDDSPFWRGTADVAALWEKHAIEGEAVHKFCETWGFETSDHEFGIPFGLAVMRGSYAGIPYRDLHHTRTSPWAFIPGEGDFSALVVPIHEDGKLVDILAFTDEFLWGTITGYSSSVGPTATAGHCRVYKSPWQWLLYGCDGVLPLDKAAYAALGPLVNGAIPKTQPILLAESLEHADDLVICVFGDQSFDSANELLGQELLNAQAARVEDAAADYVGVDDDRYDTVLEAKRRIKDIAEHELTNAGIISNESCYKASIRP